MKLVLKKYKWILIIVFIIIAYFVSTAVFPKTSSRFPIYVIIFLLDLYLWNAFKEAIRKRKAFTKYSLTVLYWISFAFIICLFLIGILSPDFTKDSILFTYLSGLIFIVYSAKIFTALFILLADLVQGIQYVWRFTNSKKKGKEEQNGIQDISRSKFLKSLGLLAGGVVLSGMLIGRFKWVHNFKIRKHQIKLQNLPNAFDGLKIVQLSDLHLGSWTSKKPIYEVVEMVNDLKPDLIFFTGDLVNFSTREAFKYEEALGKLKAKMGIYTVLGNHDYGDYVNWSSPEAKENNMTQLYDFYRRIGWKLLRNENQIIKKKNAQLAILGVENWGDNTRFPQLGDVAQSLKGAEHIETKLMLSHDPSHWEKIISKQFKEIDITFSGHTHGFQFGIETPAFRWSPAQYLYKYWAGLYRLNEQFIYVNRGTGFLGYPGRIGILPEITEIDLVKS
jgi:predicted MPP superfamily phosphohydrolase